MASLSFDFSSFQKANEIQSDENVINKACRNSTPPPTKLWVEQFWHGENPYKQNVYESGSHTLAFIPVESIALEPHLPCVSFPELYLCMTWHIFEYIIQSTVLTSFI